MGSKPEPKIHPRYGRPLDPTVPLPEDRQTAKQREAVQALGEEAAKEWFGWDPQSGI